MKVKDTQARRKPRQQRSRKRVENIIEATGQLLDEVGYAKLTTNAIAARAETSIGSLYQFFPNKDAVISQLVQGYRDDLHSFLDASVSVDMARGSIMQLVDVVVDGIEQLRQRSPGFGSMLWLRSDEQVTEATTIQLDKDIIGPLSELLAAAYPQVPPEKRQLAMAVVAESTKALLSKMSRSDLEAQASMLDELKRMLGLYLSDIFHHNGTS